MATPVPRRNSNVTVALLVYKGMARRLRKGTRRTISARGTDFLRSGMPVPQTSAFFFSFFFLLFSFVFFPPRISFFCSLWDQRPTY